MCSDTMFSFAVIFYLMRPFGIARLSNLFVLVALSLGGANLFFYYQVEFAARLYCPKQVGFDRLDSWLINVLSPLAAG